MLINHRNPCFLLTNHLVLSGQQGKVERPPNCLALDYELEIACRSIKKERTGCLLELGPDVHRWLKHGDEVELEITALGNLKNTVC
jgi:2-keto-4-pentenoate hydratase/2-oxohepta-3-ene-1,7-dioic acid hydratase in catechol pathway